ncbi:MAG: histidine phosphatase family protein [Deltaproteobacteria bacterium]|nr:histidine phosphatase family protein [Deltaproteobacteria bacterium]
MAKRVILIRHGDLGEGCRGRYIGRTEAPLSENGMLQAVALAGELGRLKGAHLICSPLLRTRQTAEIALGAADACDIDADLREIDFGRWEGRGFTEIAAADPAVVERWAALDGDFTFPGGERVGDFSKRVGAVAGRIAADPAETVVAFTHGGVIRFLICRFLGLEVRHYLLFDIRPGSLTEIGLEEGKGVLTRLNDRCHVESI